MGVAFELEVFGTQGCTQLSNSELA